MDESRVAPTRQQSSVVRTRTLCGKCSPCDGIVSGLFGYLVAAGYLAEILWRCDAGERLVESLRVSSVILITRRGEFVLDFVETWPRDPRVIDRTMSVCAGVAFIAWHWLTRIGGCEGTSDRLDVSARKLVASGGCKGMSRGDVPVGAELMQAYTRYREFHGLPSVIAR